MVRACVFATLLFAAACRTEPTPPPEPSPAPPAPVDTSSATIGPVMLNELSAGDRGCYVTATGASGEALPHLGAFELCEDTTLVGKSVRLVTEKQAVQATSCAGDPECKDTEVEDLVMRIEPAG